MAKIHDSIFVLILDVGERLDDVRPYGNVARAHLILGAQHDGTYKVVKDRYGWFREVEKESESVFERYLDPDTIEDLVDHGARTLKRFVRNLGSNR